MNFVANRDKSPGRVECGAFANLALEAIERACKKCNDIPFADHYAPPPVSDEITGTPQYPNWIELSDLQKMSALESIIQSDIRPYIELDAGGIEISKVEGYKIVIVYQGACTSCYSATGATLSAIQKILRTKVHADIEVIPDSSVLTFS